MLLECHIGPDNQILCVKLYSISNSLAISCVTSSEMNPLIEMFLLNTQNIKVGFCVMGLE